VVECGRVWKVPVEFGGHEAVRSKASNSQNEDGVEDLVEVQLLQYLLPTYQCGKKLKVLLDSDAP